jgi:GT2 family glycosyltransferase
MNVLLNVGDRLNLVIVCVNYHNDGDTISFVRSILSQEINLKEIDLHLSVVDCTPGAANDNLSMEIGKINNEKVTLLRKGENLGYFGAVKYALSEYSNRSGIPDLLIVSNTDIAFENQFVLNKICTKYVSSEVSVIAPSILDQKKGYDHNPHMMRRPSNMRMHFYKWMFKNYYTSILYRGLSYLFNGASSLMIKRNKFFNTPVKIYAPNGAFMIFTKNYFKAGGNFDYPCFLFDEEIFVAESILASGGVIMYDPEIKVIHDANSTTGSIFFKNSELFGHFRKSTTFCADQYFPIK